MRIEQFLYILSFCLCLSLPGHAQTQKITLKLKEVKLEEVFDEIAELSGLTFLYSDEQIVSIVRRTYQFDGAELRVVLDSCLIGTGLTYQIIDKTVVLTPLELRKMNREVVREYVTLGGVVHDENGKPLAGVNIFVKNLPGMGVISRHDGTFLVKVCPADVLVFSYLGYRSQERLAQRFQNGSVVKMEKENVEIEEVQVVGFGVQRKITTTGAISTMDVYGRNFPVTSFSNMITGNVSGIIGVQRSGEPGQDVSEFWVRGISTFGASDKALILIDGVERTTFNDLIAEDIASFSVLKDASATAVYGARGANGVLLINTRRGMMGATKIQANVRMMYSCLPTLPRYLRAYDYARLANEARQVRGEALLFDPAMFDVIQYHLDPDLYPDVDWQKEILKKWTKGVQANVNVSGGGEICRYFVSLNYKGNDAAYRESGKNRYHTNILRKQYSFRANTDINLTRSTELETKLAVTMVDMNRPGIGSTDSVWAAQAALNPLTVPVRYSTGQWPAYGQGSQASPTVLMNETGFIHEFQNNVELKLGINQDCSFLLPGLSLSFAFAYDMTNLHRSKREKMPELFRATGRTVSGDLILETVVSARPISFSSESGGERCSYLEGKFVYERKYGDHRLGGLLLYNQSQYTKTEAVDEISSIPKRTQGIAGRLNYSYKDIYLSEVNFGYNGSENFPSGQRFCFFPSVSVGWVLSGYASFQKALPAVHFLKLRYSFGSVGNDQIGGVRFPYLTYISSDSPGYAFGDRGQNVKSGLAESIIGARNLVWEQALKHDLGIDCDISGKLRIEADYFREVRKHIFMRREELPAMAGLPNVPYGNVGRMRNEGFDGTLCYRDKMGGVAFEIRGNLTITRNKILEYDEPELRYPYQRQSGRSIHQARGYIALGYFRDSAEIINSPVQLGAVRPGDLKYKDVNGDGVINEEDVLPIGHSMVPAVQYGIAGSLKWRNWDFGVFFRGAGRVNFFYGGMGYFPFSKGTVGNVLTVAGGDKNRWIPAWYSGDPATENPRARFPRLSYGENVNNTVPSTHWLANGAYLRLKTLEIGYTFSSLFLRRVGISAFRLSVLGDNLQVWDQVKLWDPEQASGNGAVYPLTRSFVLNVQLTF